MPASPQYSPKFGQLIDWMAARNMSARELARRLPADKMTVSRLLNGRLRYIDPALAVAIERETSGEVTAADFITFMSQDREVA